MGRVVEYHSFDSLEQRYNYYMGRVVEYPSFD
jgi:hypothetical protein